MTKKSSIALCAQCNKEFDRSIIPETLWPFCSKRCKMIDLGKWLNEKYVIDSEEAAASPIITHDEDNNE